MNILKKALLLIPFVLMGMLLLSSHTIIDSSFFTDDDDYRIVLDVKNPRNGNRCDITLPIGKTPDAPVNWIRVTVFTDEYFIRESGYSNPVFAEGLHSEYDIFSCQLTNLYQWLPNGIHNFTIETVIYTPNGSVELDDYQFSIELEDSSCQ